MRHIGTYFRPSRLRGVKAEIYTPFTAHDKLGNIDFEVKLDAPPDLYFGEQEHWVHHPVVHVSVLANLSPGTLLGTAVVADLKVYPGVDPRCIFAAFMSLGSISGIQFVVNFFREGDSLIPILTRFEDTRKSCVRNHPSKFHIGSGIWAEFDKGKVSPQSVMDFVYGMFKEIVQESIPFTSSARNAETYTEMLNFLRGI